LRQRLPAGLLGYKFSVREGEQIIRKFCVANIWQENGKSKFFYKKIVGVGASSSRPAFPGSTGGAFRHPAAGGVAGYGLRVTGYGLRVTGYGLRVAGGAERYPAGWYCLVFVICSSYGSLGFSKLLLRI